MQQQQPGGTTPATAQEVTALNGHQVVVFASGGIVTAVAIRPVSCGCDPCVVVDFDDHTKDQPLERFIRMKLGTDQASFDRAATYIW